MQALDPEVANDCLGGTAELARAQIVLAMEPGKAAAILGGLPVKDTADILLVCGHLWLACCCQAKLSPKEE